MKYEELKNLINEHGAKHYDAAVWNYKKSLEED